MNTYLHTLHALRRGWQLLFLRRPWLLAMLFLLTVASLAPRRSQAQAPANDLCANAGTLVSGTTCVPTSGTLFGATADPAFDTNNDVWYQFTATSTEAFLEFSGPAYGNFFINVFESPSCPNNTATNIAFGPAFQKAFINGLIPTHHYYVRLYSANVFTAVDGTFTICLTQPYPAPANDLCTAPQTIVKSTPCVGTAGTVGGATGNPALDDNDDVWYSFVASSTQHTIEVTATTGASLFTDVYGVACPTSSSTVVHTGNSNTTMLTGLTPGTTYTVRVSNAGTQAGFLPPTDGAFTICVDNPSNAPANDECAGAIALTPGASCASTSGTLFGATQSTVAGNCGGTPDDDVWYKFVATSPNAGITTTSTGGLDLVLNLRAGSCGSTASLRCGDQSLGGAGATDSISVRNLTVGQTYFVRVYSAGNVPSTANNGTFTLCVVTPGTCASPPSLTTSNITNTTAQLDWTGGAGGVRYRVEYGPAGFAPGTGTVMNVSTNFLQVTGLTASTPYHFYVTQTCGSGLTSVRVGPQYFITLGLSGLIVNTVTNVPGGTYDYVTVTSTGVATLTGTLVVNVGMTVEAGGALVSNCQQVTGAGSFTLASGAELRICDPAGLFATGNFGPIRVTGTRSFDTDASYTYNGTVAQSTGPGLPGTVRALTLNNAAGLVLATGVDVRRELRLTNGNLNTNALPVRLLSGPSGTALIDNTGGTVNGTVQAQRYVGNTLNPGLGYRHFSAPVQGANVNQLATSGSPIVTNPLYNTATAAVRPTITPYPTVFSYDQTQVQLGSTVAEFDKGWQSPASNAASLSPMQGYTAQVSGGQTVTFSGTPTNGPQSVTGLGNSSGSQSGWHLLGNPYPSPIDWSTMTTGFSATDNLLNVGSAVYVFQTTGQYAGTYRSYQNGVGGDPLIASGQAFFVRKTALSPPGIVRLDNPNRVTTWTATNSTFNRTATDLRPQLRLALTGSPGIAPDETTVYFEAGATAAADARFDAYKLRNPGAANFYSLAGADELTINGLPLLATAEVVVPLGLSLLAPGPCVIHLDDLANFLATTGVLLRDNLLGTLTDLRQQPSYAFTAPAGNLASTTRFALVLRPNGALATHAGLQASQVTLYPNPAHQSATLLLPAVADAHTATAVLLDALGRTLWQRTLPVGPTGSSTVLDLRSLPTGVYLLRLQAGASAPVTKRLTVE